MIIPVIMILVPGFVFPGGSSPPAAEAMPPPMAWMVMETMSKVMEILRYILEEMRLYRRPYLLIILPRM